MIQKIKKAFYAVSSAMLILPAMVLAQGGYTPPPVIPGVPTETNATDLIMKIINWLLGFIGSLAVLMIVIAGIMYITSAGDEGRVDKAKTYLTYAVVGLVVALLGYVIVSIVGSALK